MTKVIFYTNNPFVAGDENPVEAVLKERLRELMYEGKRWYDIRTLGYTEKYSTANSSRLLWPIDANTLTNNKELNKLQAIRRIIKSNKML